MDDDEKHEHRMLKVLVENKGWDVCASYTTEQFYRFMVQKRRFIVKGKRR